MLLSAKARPSLSPSAVTSEKNERNPIFKQMLSTMRPQMAAAVQTPFECNIAHTLARSGASCSSWIVSLLSNPRAQLVLTVGLWYPQLVLRPNRQSAERSTQGREMKMRY